MASSSSGDGNILFPVTVFETRTITDGSFRITLKLPPEISQLPEEEKAAIIGSIEEVIRQPEFRQAMYEQNGRPFQIAITYSTEFEDDLLSQGWQHIDVDDPTGLEGAEDE